MTDRYGRKIEYLRLSVTDLCNFRCIYCMDEDGVKKREHHDILSIEELTDIAEAAYKLGIKKVRLTGGEPLVRKGIVTLCENIRAVSPDIELSMTTNGSLLTEYAEKLKKAGLDRLNISLDTLDPDNFERITRTGRLDDVLDGIKAAREAGFSDIKLNAVLIGGINDADALGLIDLTKDNDITVRFIELMPLGVVSGWKKERFINCSELLPRFPDAEMEGFDGVSRLYRPNGHKGAVGLITPLSKSFCDRCNKIRVTADGKLKPCLHSDVEINLRGLSGDDLSDAIRNGILLKPMKHSLGEYHSETTRNMNEIGG